MKSIDIIRAIEDKKLFRPLFRDLNTWANWIAFLKTLFALPMTEEELTVYRSCTGRERPSETPFHEAWVPTGRRSGKSLIAALVGVFLACFRNYRPFLARGERARVLIISPDRTQSSIVFGYIRSFLTSNSMLSRMVENERAESIDLNNGVVISVVTCNYKSVRGFTSAAVICDEVAYWSADDGRNPATEVLRALRPSLASIPGSLLLAISSPYSRSGPLWDMFQRHHGRDDSDILCWQAASRTMNPTISQAVIDRDMLLDPEAAQSEWYGTFRSDLESYLPEESIRAVTVQGRYELSPIPGIHYTAFVDPSGGRNDAAALGVAHLEKDRVVLDLARRWPAPHDPAVVVGEQAEILKGYGVNRITGDKYAGAWPEQEFRKFGIPYQSAAKDKSSLYLDFLPIVLSGKIELLDSKHLFAELRSLERRTRKGGRDSVDHPPNSHDDLANSVAGVATQLMGSAIEPAFLNWIRGQHVEAVKADPSLTGRRCPLTGGRMSKGDSCDVPPRKFTCDNCPATNSHRKEISA
jgi:hypothetical protein